MSNRKLGCAIFKHLMFSNVRQTSIVLQRLSSRYIFKSYQARSHKNLARRMAAAPELKEQLFDYFLILDFEATCDNNKRIKPQEIIEFPVLKVNAKTFETESVFHHYVQPRVHPELSSFCTELTGIVQDMVDGQPHLEEVLQNLEGWMEKEGLLREETKSIFVTCGDWDLKTMLPNQCTYFDINYPDYLKKWINIKKPYADVTMHFPKGMIFMLSVLGIKHIGRHHSGIDDCKNIANILKALAEKGCVFKATKSFVT